MSTNCPTCAGRGKIENAEFENRDRFMRHRFEDELMRYIKSNPEFRRETCLLCVEKHIGRAMQYQRELFTAVNSGTVSGEGKINVYKNFLSIIGELNLAAEEAAGDEELYTILKAAERTARYEHFLPDYNVLTAALVAAKEKENTLDLNFSVTQS